jgi:hypothetical protein
VSRMCRSLQELCSINHGGNLRLQCCHEFLPLNFPPDKLIDHGTADCRTIVYTPYLLIGSLFGVNSVFIRYLFGNDQI